MFYNRVGSVYYLINLNFKIGDKLYIIGWGMFDLAPARGGLLVVWSPYNFIYFGNVDIYKILINYFIIKVFLFLIFISFPL